MNNDNTFAAALKNFLLKENMRLECRAWIIYAMKQGLSVEVAKEQWIMYWSGVRDGRLRDATRYLINKYGFRKLNEIFELLGKI
jgi:hypothetical protein